MLLQERVLNHGVTDVASLINTKTLSTSKQKGKVQFLPLQRHLDHGSRGLGILNTNRSSDSL